MCDYTNKLYADGLITKDEMEEVAEAHRLDTLDKMELLFSAATSGKACQVDTVKALVAIAITPQEIERKNQMLDHLILGMIVVEHEDWMDTVDRSIAG